MRPTKIITAPLPKNQYFKRPYEELQFIISESERKQQPTPEEIEELRILMLQLKIFVNVPNFQTRKDLDKFRRELISAM
jgi:hypothetical protein